MRLKINHIFSSDITYNDTMMQKQQVHDKGAKHMNIPFDEKLKIGDHLIWNTLKYGYCSYFALAYQQKYPRYTQFLAIMEYDEEVEKEYLVHFLIIDGKEYVDAFGRYTKWYESVKEMVDIEFMDLRTYVVENGFIKGLIEEDFGRIDTVVYNDIKAFVDLVY